MNHMNNKDALKVFGLDGSATFADIKTAYRRACSQYHPDRNPAGLEMMKVINCAWQSLSDYVEGSVKVEPEGDELNLTEEMSKALNAIITLGLTIEICGTWVWVSGDTKPHKEILKESGYKWAPVKKLWHWRPEGKRSWSRGKFTMDDIRSSHGSQTVKSKSFARLSP